MDKNTKKNNTVTTSALIFDDQHSFIQVNNLNLSRLIRAALNDYILKIYNVDLAKIAAEKKQEQLKKIKIG